MKHLLASLLFLFHPPSPQPTMKLSQFCSDSRTHAVALTWQGAAFTPGTDWSLIWTAKHKAADDDAAAVIQKASGAGITVTGSSASIAIVPLDTKNLSPGGLVWGIRAQNVTTGESRTVAMGTLTLARDVARETTTTLPVYTTNPPILLGAPGKSAYQSYLDTTTADPPLSEAAWATPNQVPAPITGEFMPFGTASQTLTVTGTLTPDITGYFDIAGYSSGNPCWKNSGADSTPDIGFIERGDGAWYFNAASSEGQYSAYCISEADSPVGLTEWIVTRGSGQPTIVAEPQGETVPGVVGQEYYDSSGGVYKCISSSPVIWVKLN